MKNLENACFKEDVMQSAVIDFKNIMSFQKSPYLFFDAVKPKNQTQLKKIRMGYKDFYFCYHPDQAKYILQDNIKNFPNS